jgi:tripartite-type tricarboxylate transporter receptor subunit TctC
LAHYLGKPVTVLNKPGAGGAVGLEFVATGVPDGHTIVHTPTNIVIIPHITPNVNFSYRDFQPLNLIMSFPYLILVNSKSSFMKLGDLVDYGKKNPGKLTHGSSGAGAYSTFAGDLISSVANFKITQIPYVGEGPIVVALLGGQVDFGSCGIAAAFSYIKSGQVRALAVYDSKRYKGLPDVPTVWEEGYGDSSINAWQMYLVPVKTPKEVVDKLAKTLQVVLKEEETIKAIENLGAVVENWGPEESARYLKSEDENWSKIIKRIGFKTPSK